MTEARHFFSTRACDVGQVGVTVAVVALVVVVVGCSVVVGILGKSHLLDTRMLLFELIALVRFPLFHFQQTILHDNCVFVGKIHLDNVDQ